MSSSRKNPFITLQPESSKTDYGYERIIPGWTSSEYRTIPDNEDDYDGYEYDDDDDDDDDDYEVISSGSGVYENCSSELKTVKYFGNFGIFVTINVLVRAGGS